MAQMVSSPHPVLKFELTNAPPRLQSFLVGSQIEIGCFDLFFFRARTNQSLRPQICVIYALKTQIYLILQKITYFANR